MNNFIMSGVLLRTLNLHNLSLCSGEFIRQFKCNQLIVN